MWIKQYIFGLKQYLWTKKYICGQKNICGLKNIFVGEKYIYCV